MKTCVIAVLVFGLFKSILSFSVERLEDSIRIALEQVLSDITFEIVPYPTYPSYPDYQPLPPYPINPYYPDSPCLYESYPIYPYYPDIPCLYETYPVYPNFYEPFEWPYPPASGKSCPVCGCYRDIQDPCVICDDLASLYICFEGFDCSVPPPYLYFPPVEYPISPIDFRSFYYGQSWCI